ncbi:MAG: aminoacyl-tRNA hydrolase [Parvularculaceae bacterium]|nr:aminoacyl-tRNA hydrolase [Parvularculaceae bacterium]
MRAGPYFIDEKDLVEQFIRAAGPGGQNVNKVESAVQLRFNARASRVLPDAVIARLIKLAGARATKDGVIVIEASRFRTQERNRADARARLAALIERAAHTPKKRIATRPSLGEKRRRLESKKQRAEVKKHRGRVDFDD